MLCKNCGYTLSGNENFCPDCASPLKNEKNLVKEKAQDERTSLPEEGKIIKQEYIFPEAEAEDCKTQRRIQIFSDSAEETEIKAEKEKNYGGRIMLLLFLICAFTAATFAVADYFDLTATVFNFAKTSGETEAPVTFDHKSSVVKPDKSLVPTSAYIMSGKGITLRKGPGKSYAPLVNLKELTQVQICGESFSEAQWVYVCYAEEEIYGWADAAFIADSEFDKTYENTTVTEGTATVEEGSYIQ